MIYLFSGDDIKNKHSAYAKFIKAIPKGTENFFISRNNFNRTQIESLYSGAGLFFAKSAAVFSNVFEREELADFILSKLPQMAESSNDFVFLEGKLSKPITDAFKKVRAEINVFEAPKERAEKFNSFVLANAFGDKDRFNLWVYYRMALSKGVALEEMVGILFWKAKDMILKKNFGKFTEKELQNFTAHISYLLPEARKKGNDAETAFEQFLLEAF
jgi:hypothetical protein